MSLGLVTVATAVFFGCGMIAAAGLGDSALARLLLAVGLCAGVAEGIALIMLWRDMMKE